jgi:hypothetical protein
MQMKPWFVLLALVACEGSASSGSDESDESESSSASGASESGGAELGGEDQGGAAQGGLDQGGAGATAPEPCSGFASEVVDVSYGPGAGFGQARMPHIVFGSPNGAGVSAGSLDVVSLGNGGQITLGFSDQRIIDGDGPDFIVFENAFFAGGQESAVFAELATVEVSVDGETWFAFPCTATAAPFGSCAGWHPVFANTSDPTIDPQDPSEAGGDAFDLAELGLSEARFVRITDRADITGLNGSFDLDAVALVHAVCD